MTNRYERIRKARKALEGLRERFAREAAHPALEAEIERLRKLLDRMVVCNPDGSVGIRVTEDALNAAAELYRLFGDAKKEAGNE